MWLSVDRPARWAQEQPDGLVTPHRLAALILDVHGGVQRATERITALEVCPPLAQRIPPLTSPPDNAVRRGRTAPL